MNDPHRITRIQPLIDQLRHEISSVENMKRKANWQSFAGLPGIFVRHLPRKEAEKVPFIADLDREMWGTVLEADLREVYSNPLCYLEFELRKKLYAFQHFPDDNPLTNRVTMWFGVGFCESVLGIPQERARATQEPWVGKTRLIQDRQDLDTIEVPDFWTNERARFAREFYERMKDAAGDGIEIVFPEWDFGPFGIATHVRGVEDLSIDGIEDGLFVHRLMDYLYEAKVNWSLGRAQYLGCSPQTLYLANDDVNVPLISPHVYREFVLPYEQKISRFHGGIDYWHSCGRIDPVLSYIQEIPGLKMVHISPWTDLEKSVSVTGLDLILEVVLNPIDDVLNATPDQMTAKLEWIEQVCHGRCFTVRADACQIYTTIEEDLGKIRTWIELCRRFFG